MPKGFELILIIMFTVTALALLYAPSSRASAPDQSASTQVTYTVTLQGADQTTLSIDGGGGIKVSGTYTVTLDGSQAHTFQVLQVVCQSGWECGNQVSDWRNGKRLVVSQASWSVPAGTIQTQTYTNTMPGYYSYECYSYDSHGSCDSGGWVYYPGYTTTNTRQIFVPPCQPCSYTFQYAPQYRLVVQDKYAASSPLYGWYDSCASVPLPPPSGYSALGHGDAVAGAAGVRYMFNGWAIDGSGSTATQVTMCAPHLASATYITQYQLQLNSQCPVDFQPVGAGWYDAGSTQTITIENSAPMEGFFGFLGGRFLFTGWVGTMGLIDTPAAQVTMSQPQTYVATCRADWTWPLVFLFVPGIGIIVLLGGVVIGIIRWPPWARGRGRRPRWPFRRWPPWNPGGRVGPGGPPQPFPGGPGTGPGPSPGSGGMAPSSGGGMGGGGGSLGPSVQAPPGAMAQPGGQATPFMKPGLSSSAPKLGPGLQPKIGPGLHPRTIPAGKPTTAPVPIIAAPSTKKHCKQCGEELRPNLEFCTKCGTYVK